MAVQQLDAIAFPKLDDEQMAKLGRYAGVTPKKLRAGEALFRVGDLDSSFFVIKSGEVELVDDTGDQQKIVRVLGTGEFTGDVGHLSGNPKVVSAIALIDCEVYEISDKA
jgi:CRP-like cAMP-binding protein